MTSKQPPGGKKPGQPPKNPPPPPPPPGPGDTVAAGGEDWLGLGDDVGGAPAKPPAPPPPVTGRTQMILTADGRLVPADSLKNDTIAAGPGDLLVGLSSSMGGDTIAANPGEILGAGGPPPAAAGDTIAAGPGELLKPPPKSDKPQKPGGIKKVPPPAPPKPAAKGDAAKPKKPSPVQAADTIAAAPGQIPGSGGPTDTSSLKTMVADMTSPNHAGDTIAAPPGQVPSMGDTSSMKTMVADMTSPNHAGDTIAAPPGKVPGMGDTGSMKTLVADFTPSAARTPSQVTSDTGSMKTLVSDFTPSGARTPSQVADTGSMKTLVGPPPSSAATPSQLLGDTRDLKTMVGTPSGAGNPPSHPTGDMGNMATLVSDVASPSGVRKPGSHPSGLKSPAGTKFPSSSAGPSATPSGTRFPVSGGSSSHKVAVGASGVLQAGMAAGKRWQPSPEDIAEVLGDNQLGNLQPVENGRILGQYILMKKLGQGGMGAVYRGIKMGLNTDVAIKILFAHLAAAKGGSDHQARFLREAQLAASLDHGNLVRVIDVQQDFNSGILYLVMEFVEGHSVADLIKDKTTPLEEEEALELIIGACKGLRAAHQQNIVHRDIKPDNIMIRNRDKVVKVADMGLAKAIGDQDEVSVSRTESVIGTPAYMAPEQARDSKHVDLRADIYSMGATLFHMTTLRLPFEDPQLFMLLKKVITEPVPDPRTYNEKLSENLSRIIKKCMAKMPDNRYQRIDELIDDLEIALRNIRGEKDAVVDDIKLVVPEMEAEPPKPWYYHPVTWAIIFLLVLGGSVYGVWYFATGGKSEFERTVDKANDYITTNFIAKAEEEIGKLDTLAKGDDEKKKVDEVKHNLIDQKYKIAIDEGKALLNRDKDYKAAEAKFVEAQKFHNTDEARTLIEQAKMGPYRDQIKRLIAKDVAKFDDARQQLADAAKALEKDEKWLADNELQDEINLAEGLYRVNEQINSVGQFNATEETVVTAQKVANDWLAKTKSNTQVSSQIDELKKLAVKNVFQPRAENELRDEKFDDVPKSIDWIKKLSPGDKLIDTLSTRLKDARQAKDNRERREKTDKLLADAETLMASKSLARIAETQDIKLLETVKGDYVEAQKYEDYPRDDKGEYLLDDKGQKKPRRSDLGFNNLQDLTDRYNIYQRFIKDGDDRLEFQRFDDAVDAYLNAGKVIKTDQVSERITRANDRKANHEAIQNIETTLDSDPLKAATYLQDKLDKVSDDPDLLRVKEKLLKITRPPAYELPDMQLRMKLIPAGEFSMGNEKGDEDEKPVHKVRLRYPYYMSITEVTVKQYEALVPSWKRPLDAAGRPVPDEMPVTGVSWEEAGRFAQLLTDREKVKLKEHEVYRLPTEAEWEYAARGDDGRIYPWGNDWQQGYCQGGSANFDLEPTVVGSFPSGASPFGILDMAGNVSEFCSGGYDAHIYTARAQLGVAVDPRAGDDTNLKVVRGGSAFTMQEKLRATKRFSLGKKDSGNGVGIRLVRTVEPLAIDKK